MSGVTRLVLGWVLGDGVSSLALRAFKFIDWLQVNLLPHPLTHTLPAWISSRTLETDHCHSLSALLSLLSAAWMAVEAVPSLMLGSD